MPHFEDGYVLVPEDGAKAPKVLPDGVVPVGSLALGAQRLITSRRAGAASDVAANAAEDVAAGEESSAESDAAFSEKHVYIAAFDFDGTCLSGNSPVMLVRYLARLGMLRKSVIARIILWGGAYKARLPQNESWVRGLVFSAFRGKPVGRVNEFLRSFYAEVVSPRFRAKAARTMQEHLDAGHVVVCVSATFEPIIAAAMLEYPIQYAVATRMAVDAYGCYTDKVEGLPVEGAEKMAALRAFADEQFGEGSWELSWAYGDHHSDRALLAAANVAYAVTPDRPLTRTARERGYQILDWE